MLGPAGLVGEVGPAACWHHSWLQVFRASLGREPLKRLQSQGSAQSFLAATPGSPLLTSLNLCLHLAWKGCPLCTVPAWGLCSCALPRPGVTFCAPAPRPPGPVRELEGGLSECHLQGGALRAVGPELSNPSRCRLLSPAFTGTQWGQSGCSSAKVTQLR